ncbi:MAG: nitrous oxide-stimulated promoter family protein [Paludibacteraceae bacterium]
MSSIAYEISTVRKIIYIYCRKKHRSPKNELCEACNTLFQYAHTRLQKCPFGDEKGACADCKIHCYNITMRNRMKKVMRYSGPRMLFFYPKDFLRHIFIDGIK